MFLFVVNAIGLPQLITVDWVIADNCLLGKGERADGSRFKTIIFADKFDSI